MAEAKTIPATKMIVGIVDSRSVLGKSLLLLKINSAVILQEIQWEKICKLKPVVKLH